MLGLSLSESAPGYPQVRGTDRRGEVKEKDRHRGHGRDHVHERCSVESAVGYHDHVHKEAAVQHRDYE